MSQISLYFLIGVHEWCMSEGAFRFFKARQQEAGQEVSDRAMADVDLAYPIRYLVMSHQRHSSAMLY